jgi:hypothetical protein
MRWDWRFLFSIIFLDKLFGDRRLFMDRDKMNILLHYETRRKCGQCKEFIVLEKEWDKVVYYKSTFQHIDCLCNKMLSKKIGKMNEEEVGKLIDSLKKETEEHLWSVVVRNHLFKHLISHYELVGLSNYEYMKMEEIFTGSFKDMSRPIPAEQMLDMIERKQEHYDNVIRKMKINSSGKVNYLLGMIIKDYPSYVDFVGKSKVEKEQAEVLVQMPKIDLGYLSQIKNNNPAYVNVLDDGEGD